MCILDLFGWTSIINQYHPSEIISIFLPEYRRESATSLNIKIIVSFSKRNVLLVFTQYSSSVSIKDHSWATYRDTVNMTQYLWELLHHLADLLFGQKHIS